MKEHEPSPQRKPNRLLKEQSPYLRQHAYNPVDWYPWAEQALKRAREEDKPILLSIGYSACHWCHVMERESFENEEIARLINENFVAIKVDREERADLDQIYMDAVQLMVGRGGWPLTVFLMPDGRPYYGGTYFPPEDRHGMPGFPRILRAAADAYRNQSREIQGNVERLTAAMASLSRCVPGQEELRPQVVIVGARALAAQYDNVYGGFGRGPKFPNTFVCSLFLRMATGRGESALAEMVRYTLRKMAWGGVYDQLGGGFHRYSVDAAWLVPHFEKMLYDNALLARLYLDAGRALGEPAFLEVAREVVEYVLRELTSPEGGFYSSQDADSDGEEGKFFLWRRAEVREVLGPELATIAERYFDITEGGNFERANVLHRTLEVVDAARMFGIAADEMARAIAEIRRKLFAARERRVKPARDDKILAAWNGLMIGCLAEAYRTLGEARYLEACRKAADFLISTLWDGHMLRRSFKDGSARFNAYLEDYALLSDAMIDSYEASLDRVYLGHAQMIADAMLEHFVDRDAGGFFFTSDEHEELFTRAKPAFDGSTPSGNSAAVMALLRLYAYSGKQRYLDEAERALRLFSDLMEKQPFAFSHMLEALDLYHGGPTEIVLVGDPGSPQFRQWTAQLGLLYLPNRAIFAADPRAAAVSFLPEQVRGKTQLDNKLTAYVCRNRTCSAPMVSLEDLKKELAT